MIYVDETAVAPAQVADEHRKLANAMMSLASSAGWQLIKAKLESDLGAAHSSMLAAKTGDESLKACTAYTTLKAIIDAPENSAKKSLQRLHELEKEEVEETDLPPVHHRAGPGITFAKPPKK